MTNVMDFSRKESFSFERNTQISLKDSKPISPYVSLKTLTDKITSK
jgi:hypothetical protein